MIYLDGCYIAKFYLAEPDSAAVTQRILLEGKAASLIQAQVEVNAVFYRKYSEGALTKEDYELLCAQLDADCAAGLWIWFPLTQAVVQRTVTTVRQLPSSTFIRTGDALHLSTAAEHGFTEIFTSDRHMLASATHFGLKGVKL
jgi:predicted nucleic acid-binding protein